MNLKTKIQKQRAFTLIEVLVAMVIFSVGLLGLAGLQSLGMTNGQTAFFRTIAMQQAYNMSDRMRNNIPAVDAGTFDAVDTSVVALGTNCLTATCTPAALANFDLFEWQANNAAELPQGVGSITRVGSQFVVCVMWNELKVPAPVAVPNCTAIPSTYDPTTEFKFYTLRFEL